MRTSLALSFSALILASGSGQASAQTRAGTCAVPHTPVSIVDERECVQAYGPPGLPPMPTALVPNYAIGSGTLNIGDGWPEDFLWAEPIPAPTGPVPLVVVFHKFGTSPQDMVVNTLFPQECGNQGWYAVCPRAANTQHFGSLPSQVHTEAVILDMMQRFPMIDPNRIYAAGFSMGSGAAANYAARHLDPSKPMIAATIAMSGGFSLKYSYLCDPPGRIYMDFWFGNGTAGSADPFKMARSSTINFDPNTFQIDAGEDLARNLTHMPLQLLRATDETVWYQPVVCDVMSTHVQSLGVPLGPNFDYQFVPFGFDVYDHRWSMLDFHWACEWFKTKTLSLPTSARTLADRDDVYFHFFVEQDAAGSFTPFQWSLDSNLNRLQLIETSNLKRFTVDTLAAGLDPTQPLYVDLGVPLDGHSDTIWLRNYLAVPSSVTRDGVPTNLWIYDAAASQLKLLAVDGLAHAWVITP